jgi:hypothetical protein
VTSGKNGTKLPCLNKTVETSTAFNLFDTANEITRSGTPVTSALKEVVFNSVRASTNCPVFPLLIQMKLTSNLQRTAGTKGIFHK